MAPDTSHPSIASARAGKLTSRRRWSLLMNYPEDLYAFVQLGMHHRLAHPLPQCRVNLLVFAHMKQLRTYMARLKLQAPDVLIWHEMDYWGKNRYGSPRDEMKDRMSVLVAIARRQPVIIATTCLALLEKTIPAQLFAEQCLELATGDEMHLDELIEGLQRRGYLPCDHLGGYGTYYRRDQHVHITPPGRNESLRMRFSAQNKLLAIEPLQASRRGEGSLSSYAIYPAHETVITDAAAREEGAQVLYDQLLRQNTAPQQRARILEHVHNDEPFAGYHKLSPLIRKGAGQAETTLLDHLSAATPDDFLMWHFMSREQRDQVVAEGLARAVKCYQLEQEVGEPTIHPQEYFSDAAQIEMQLATHGYQAVLYNYAAPEVGRGASSVFSGTEQSLMSLSSRPAVAGAPSETNAQEELVMLRDYLRSPGVVMPQGTRAATSGVKDGSVAEFLHSLAEGGARTVESMAGGGSAAGVASQAKVVLVCKDVATLASWEVLLDGLVAYAQLDSPWDVATVLTSALPLFISVSPLRRDYYLVYENIHYIPAAKLGVPAGPGPRRQHQPEWQDYLRSLTEIAVGDLVVHRDHGVGRYLGLVELGVHGGGAECLKVEYAGGDKIYVPIHHLTYLQKYSSGPPAAADETAGGLPSQQRSTDGRLDHLARRSTWRSRAAKVKQAVRDMAAEILRVHSRRQLVKLEPYDPPGSIYQQFLQAFPYVETPDQVRFCEDIEQDFSSGKPMDRLLIGDVGFGKTELAMRAAMRTILEGHQVMVLCPTTVLCYQHVRTFQTRLAPFGIKVAGVNRFVKSQQLSELAAELERGELDVLIGTHKILAKSFKPRQLGLVIIDEEQRFGVAHKEKIKALKAHAAVLALSATPIPRTMHMSMLGLRDISLLTTPPEGRRPVKNAVITWDDHVIAEAIRAEIRRGGQVFCVHNRVRDLAAFSRQIKALVPELTIRTAHGQMNETALEDVVLAFSRNEFPILICTSIMEAGVDMPNVNTLIVHKSQSFGLAQLYQLRGRVGRSSVQAYAYFITAPAAQLTDDAARRMQVMMAYQGLGAGFSIASYDMDLRGVGDLLGQEQSGHVATVGLEMYTSMLDEALKEARGEVMAEQQNCEIQLRVAYGIDGSYIEREQTRLRIYKKLFQLTSAVALEELVNQLSQEYGPLPAKTTVLIEVVMVKLALLPLRAKALREVEAGVYAIEIFKLPEAMVAAVSAAIRQQPEVYSLTDATHLTIKLAAHAPAKRLTLLAHKITKLTGAHVAARELSAGEDGA